jgi:hypothetical protein
LTEAAVAGAAETTVTPESRVRAVITAKNFDLIPMGQFYLRLLTLTSIKYTYL